MSESLESQQLVLIDHEISEASATGTCELQGQHLRRTIPAGLALLGFALLALSAGLRQPSVSPAAAVAGIDASVHSVVELAEELAEEEEEEAEEEEEENGEDPCADLPYLRLEKVLHSNLGGQGPDKGEEGLIFQASVYHSGVQSKVAEVRLHALTEYYPTWPKANGIHGNFAELNLAPGTNTTFQVHVVDPETKQNLTLSHGSFTFVDLDHGKNKRSAEYVQVGSFSHFYIANDTELDVVHHKDKTVTFRAGKEGDGGDNPTDPVALSPLQKRRAVTLNFRNLTSLAFLLGSTEGNTTRVFHFVFRPSLLCAKTVLEDGTILKALERGVGNVVPMRDGKAAVSPLDLKQLVDEYDCADGSAASDWPDAKKAWCCDRKDVGCELLGIGDDGELLGDDGNETEENSSSGVDTTTTPSHSGATPVKAAGTLPRMAAAALVCLSARGQASP